jgi:DNA processing protein
MTATPAVQLLRPEDPAFPSELGDAQPPVRELSLRGVLPSLEHAVAIVGTRTPDPHALRFAHRLAAELAEAGCTIVSGGALGIDSAAHRGALEARGKTIAVLPTGVERPYPRGNHALFRTIVEHGALVSEGQGSRPGYDSAFLERNRIIAALARCVVIVQAPQKSGALSTAAHAKRIGRPLWVVPQAPWEPRGAGCLTLLSQGALVCRDSRDVLSLAAPGGGNSPGQQPWTPKKLARFRDLEDDELRVVEALSEGTLQVDELCERAELPAARVQRALLMLLLSKVIQEVGCGRYARTDCL